MTDLILHNRRQKRAWIDRELQKLYDAQQAFVRGDPTPEQVHLLQQERAGDEMVEKVKQEKERKKRESWWGRGKAAIGLGPKAEGERDDEARYGKVESEEVGAEVLPGKRLLEEERWVGDEKVGKSVTRAVKDMIDDRRRIGEKELERIHGIQGGPLDMLAGNVTGAVKAQTSGSTSWLGWGRGKDQS
jgi:hypothetical protein